MVPYTFDTLGASRQLRDAGMAEGVAEAVVAVFQHATSGIDLGELATKMDLNEVRAVMATKADLERLATKTDMERFATKADLDALRTATKADIEALRGEMATKTDLHALRADVSEKFRQHTLSMLGGMAALLGLFTLVGKVIG